MNFSRDLLIFESHPVQYKVPVYQALQELMPDCFEVIFATDISTRGYVDQEFGRKLAWDIPLLEGYPHRVLGNEEENPFASRRGLSGRGIFRLLWRERPRAVLLTQFNYNFDFAAYFSALVLGIPIWIRQETQDEMFGSQRGKLRALVRGVVYRILYSPVQRAFCFGWLNREHLTRHGIAPARLRMARFSVPDPLSAVPEPELSRRRDSVRSALAIDSQRLVIAFFGKLIPKKNPGLIFEAVAQLAPDLRAKIALLFVGSGELEDTLRHQADLIKGQIAVHFTGFVNQSALPDYYLSSDVVVLPSRRMGEAWGLVVNEALQAGCSVVVTDAVGCYREFCDLEKVRVIPEGDSAALALALTVLAEKDRDFRWAAPTMAEYSTAAAAEALAREIATLHPVSSVGSS